MIRDRRGAGVAEYALLLFLVIAAAGIVYRVMGGRVKHAGDKTSEQFQGGGSGGGSGPNAKNDKSGAGGANSAGGANTAGTTGAAGAGNGNAAGGGGAGAAGGGGGAGGGKAQGGGPSGSGADDQAGDEGTPLWKIMGGVFVVLFMIGGYFAFRKQKRSG